MTNIPFNSRDIKYKYPFGALSCGTEVTLRINLPRYFRCSYAFLVIHRDDLYQPHCIQMEWNGMDGDDHEWWKIVYTLPETPGLYWYHFEYETPYGRSCIFNSGNGIGRIGGVSADFQLTVYSKDFTVPQWLLGGIIYQIFPDRFAKSGTEKKNVPSGRIIRDSWGEEPYWKPNEQGKILNNDFFGGDLKGIEEHLYRLKELGVTCLYLNPIFRAYSNHRYDTGDYSQIDPLLGNEENFKSLCKTAERLGIKVILDGVFSHTGDDSIYFNKYGHYGESGAYRDKNSPYYQWYKFRFWPNDYQSWWGIETLPEVKEDCPEFIDFITGENGIVRKWLKLGASGWRLDVADELPDVFLDSLRKAAKEEKSDALVLGEVWEDASNKYAYSSRRRYLLGKQLDSVMNYPFAGAILHYLRSGNADYFAQSIMTILENYPPQVINILMNHIGTHDTVRAITLLAGEQCRGGDRQWQSGKKLSELQYEHGIRLMKMASAIQYTLPGVPSLYYGDEAGMEGYQDPFNRGCYPWGKENKELLNWYKLLGRIRNACPALKDGNFESISSGNKCVAFSREKGEDGILTIINRNDYTLNFIFPPQWQCSECLTGIEAQYNYIDMPPMSAAILGKGQWVEELIEELCSEK